MQPEPIICIANGERGEKRTFCSLKKAWLWYKTCKIYLFLECRTGRPWRCRSSRTCSWPKPWPRRMSRGPGGQACRPPGASCSWDRLGPSPWGAGAGCAKRGSRRDCQSCPETPATFGHFRFRFGKKNRPLRKRLRTMKKKSCCFCFRIPPGTEKFQDEFCLQKWTVFADFANRNFFSGLSQHFKR